MLTLLVELSNLLSLHHHKKINGMRCGSLIYIPITTTTTKKTKGDGMWLVSLIRPAMVSSYPLSCCSRGDAFHGNFDSVSTHGLIIPLYKTSLTPCFIVAVAWHSSRVICQFDMSYIGILIHSFLLVFKELRFGKHSSSSQASMNKRH